MKKKPLLVALCSGIAAMLFAIAFLKGREASIMQMVEPCPAIVSARDIAAGEAIDEGAITLVTLPRAYLQPGVLSEISDSAGRIAAIPIRKGTMLTASNARRPLESRSLSAIIPTGKRAVTIPLDEATGASGILRPDDMVDVMATFDLGNEASFKRTAMTIVENVQVVAVGSELADPLPRMKRKEENRGMFGSGKENSSLRTIPTATLALSPAEAQAILFASISGELMLSIRPFGDESGELRHAPTTIATITGGHEELIPMKRGFREYRGK